VFGGGWFAAATRSLDDYEIVNVETGSRHELRLADAAPPGSYVKNRRSGSTHDVGSVLEWCGFEDDDPVWRDIARNFVAVDAASGDEHSFQCPPPSPARTPSPSLVAQVHPRLSERRLRPQPAHGQHARHPQSPQPPTRFTGSLLLAFQTSKLSLSDLFASFLPFQDGNNSR